jgi:UDP-N-acetylmuramoyl-tripeptide--D-alanyl-D-alanine ligase
MIGYTEIIACESVIQFSKYGGSENLKITTDSRNRVDRNCFIALHGDNFNANKFINDVARDLTVIIFCKKTKDDYDFNLLIKEYPENVFVEVSDTYRYILELGEIVSKKWQSLGGSMIAVTGSNGKTTNKEMLYSLFNDVFPGLIHKTEGNLNNHIGVPLTLFELSEKDIICIAEMGMNHAGELAPLVKAISPVAGLITSIGPAHLEFLGTVENIFKEKKELFDWLDNSESNNKNFVLRENDKYLNSLPVKKWSKRLSSTNYSILDDGFKVLINGKWHEIHNKKLLGLHNKENMMQSLFLAIGMYPDLTEKLINAASKFVMPKMNRGDFYIHDDVTIYLDAYNANPSSMTSSLNAFLEHCGASGISMDKILFILGDMNELGNNSNELHSEIGQYLKEKKAETVAFVGKYTESYGHGFGNGALRCGDVEKLKKYLKNKQDKYRAIFIKGSRSLQLESLIDINGRLNLN